MLHTWLRGLNTPIPFTKGHSLSLVLTNLAMLFTLVSVVIR